MGIYDLKVQMRNGQDYDLSCLKGRVSLVVNTATGCGFTPQYEALENLYERYHEKGFEVLDFPCDQFGHQAPGSDEEIHDFCTMKYKTKFDQFAKIDVNGDNANSVFAVLKNQQPTDEIQGLKNKISMKAIKKMSKTCKNEGDIIWNFTKFLVDKNGNAVKRYSPTLDPSEIEKDIEELL